MHSCENRCLCTDFRHWTVMASAANEYQHPPESPLLLLPSEVLFFKEAGTPETAIACSEKCVQEVNCSSCNCLTEGRGSCGVFCITQWWWALPGTFGYAPPTHTSGHVARKPWSSMTGHHSPLWLVVSLAIGLGLGFFLGWKAHVARVRYLRSKRDYYGGKALEYQRNLEQWQREEWQWFDTE